MDKFKIILIYFFLDRSLSSIYYLQNNIYINQLYTSIGKIIGVCIFFTTIHMVLKKWWASHILVFIVLMAVSMLVSTVLHGGSISRWLQIFYPIMLMVPFLYTQLRTKEQTKKFVDAVSSLYLLVAIINFLQIIFSPYFYSQDIEGVQTYFLGSENHVQYPLMVGLWFNSLNKIINNKTKKTFLYVIIHFTSTFIVFSATSLIALIVCILCVYFKPFALILVRIKMKYIFYASILLFVMVVCFGGIGFLESPYMAPIIELLGKDSTLSGRTNVWMAAMMKFFNNPLFGNGVADTVNIFNVWLTNANGIYGYRTLSAHNQFLQTLVEGGVIALSMLYIFLIRVGNYIDKVPNQLSVLVKSLIIAFIILLMGEAGGWYNLWFISIMGIMLGSMYYEVKLKS